MKALEVVAFCGIPTAVLALVAFSLRRDIRDNWRALLVIAGACVLFFHRIIFLHEALSQEDANLLQLQFFSVFREAVRGFGEVPFWNSLQGAGLPNLAHPLSAMFYPLTPAFLLGNVFEAMNVFVVAHYFLAGAFALLAARRVFRTRQAALLFALLYAFNGWAVTRAAHQPAIEYLFAYAWLPLAALAFERAVAGEGVLASVTAAGAALAWMAIACPNVFVYAAAFLAVAFVLRSASLVVAGRGKAALAGAVTAAGALAFAFALGAVEYLPALELSRYSTQGRLGARLPADWRGSALSLWTVVRLYLPFPQDRPFGVYYSPGVLALVAAAYAAARAVRKGIHKNLVLASLVVLVAGVALVTKSPLYFAVSAVSDVFARASLVPAGLVLLVLPVVTLAAAGLDSCVHEKPRRVLALGYVAVALVFAELFVGFAILYPRQGQRRLTFDYYKEVADFPHLDYIASQGTPGRILVVSPEGEVLAPSYATLPRGLSRLNLHASAFAPDALGKAVEGAVAEPSISALEALGVGWIASTSQISDLGSCLAVPWPGAASHYENSVYFPMHNVAGWLAWDKSVRLYRVCDAPAVVRAEPLTPHAILTGRSGTPLESLADEDVSSFQAWTGVTATIETPNSVAISLPRVAPTRYFFAVTDYPGWRLYADERRVPLARAAGAFMAGDVPAGTRVVELRFEPTRWRASLALAVAALIFAAVSIGGRLRLPGPGADAPPAGESLKIG